MCQLIGWAQATAHITLSPTPLAPKKKFEKSRARHQYPDMGHISDHDLERYHLGMVVAEAEFAPLEEHSLACPTCAERAEQTAQYIDSLRAAIIAVKFNLE